MYARWICWAVLLVGLGPVERVLADEKGPTPDELRTAIERAIPLLEKASAGSADERTCFTCHNQAVPIFALAEAKKRGFAINEENLQRQVRHTHEHLVRGKQDYLEGRGQGGKVHTAGYALWALEDGGVAPDETTAAVTHFLLDYQKSDDHWQHPGRRPPSSGSSFATTYVALRGLNVFGTAEQAEAIAARKQVVEKWLLSTPPSDTEDRVFLLRSLKYVEGNDAARQLAIAALLDTQRDDGGWAQLADLSSDAYATGTALVALVESDLLSRDDPRIQQGLQYLVSTQLEDGSWHVVTRAEPFQTYFESGYPHGKDQFISCAGGSWATLAMLRALPGE